jgi:hypothetical protein
MHAHTFTLDNHPTPKNLFFHFNSIVMNMRKLISSVIILLFFANSGIAQQTVALHSNGEVTFFPNSSGFVAAVSAAADGDTIYLPGGIFPVSNLTISKKLTIFGVGHAAENLIATGITQINGDIYLLTGADFSYISGLFVNGNVYVGSTSANQNVFNVTIKRCHINGMLRLTADGSLTNMGSNFILLENVIGTLNGQHIRNCLIRQNIIGRLYYFRDNNQFINNIIIRTSEYFSGNYSLINGSHFENNIFIHLTYNNLEPSYSNCTFHQNAFVPNATFGTTNTTNTFQNIVNQDINTIFVNYDGAAVFSYDHDFNLKEGFAGIGYGKDGYDVGIYGTSVPFKASMLPQIPHIKTQIIATSTDQDGKLQVNIEVEAQER